MKNNSFKRKKGRKDSFRSFSAIAFFETFQTSMKLFYQNPLKISRQMI